MSLQNKASWSSCFTPPIPGSRLVFFGCEVAQGPDGANFLQEVANLAHMEVGGWTCSPYGSDGNLHKGGDFLVAQPHPSPGHSLDPVDCPPRYDGKRAIEVLRLRSPDGYQEVPVQAIMSVNFTPVSNLPEIPKAFILRGPEAEAILKTIDFAKPVVIRHGLLSIRTGQLTIMFESRKGPECRVFYILGYRLLQDACFSQTYYYASRRLERVLRQFSRA
jgi:hypothetical protein